MNMVDDTVIHGDRLFVGCLFVVLGDARVVGPELVLGVHGAEEHTVQGRFADCLQKRPEIITKCNRVKT